jgi:redox-sensitive bicupin YhaK (pirin superfamily)
MRCLSGTHGKRGWKRPPTLKNPRMRVALAMITLRKSSDRGHAELGWLDSRHTFSFANYYNADQMGFRSLRVINEDRVAPGMGFGMHPHRDMEIVSYVVSGALRHEDNMGHAAVMQAGDVQRISAGTGIEHSEFNDSHSAPVHFLQIWILPDHAGVPPRYSQQSFAQAGHDRLHLIASKLGRDDSIPIHQDADLYVAKLDAGGALTHALRNGRHAWVQLIEGGLTLNGQALEPGDGAAVSDEKLLDFRTRGGAHFLLFDLV